MQIKAIPGWPDYGASDDGVIYRITPSSQARKHGTPPYPLVPIRNSRNACDCVNIYAEGRRRAAPIAYLVARAWIGPAPTGFVVDFKNGDRRDPRPENLVYRTPREKALLHAARTA